MKACALIRENNLSVYDPSELVGKLPAEDPDETTKQKFDRVVAENATRRAMRQRQQERDRRRHEEAEAARFRVG